MSAFSIAQANRRSKAASIVAKRDVLLNSLAGTALVRSQSDPDVVYLVDLNFSACTCPDYQYRGATCKHILAARAELSRRAEEARRKFTKGQNEGAF